MRASIVIVDSSDEIRDMLGEYFEDEGFLVTTARDDQAWDVIRHRQPSAVVLERQGPLGERLLGHLRTVPGLAVVVTTTDKHLAPIGDEPIIVKPFDLQELVTAVRNRLPADRLELAS